ncbi:ABC transporter substrate-binding protein [Simiduia sp. 21SJ11W-1]|uniref:ABC transporter substrate-binding protein n=1 Tax=Simiduia sp. 21SJ11W-1 TaxID=2909669 RepID=UPI00209F0DCC|nr:ABC transporter substrate-binding protein [Simiduia sp. 21SJ11W-1]UTA47056.1 ABC transporter substrate-binding protein [Simiduia sp. 21SJ11W-1]
MLNCHRNSRHHNLRHHKCKCLLFAAVAALFSSTGFGKTQVLATYIPLADHYPAIVAYERYRDAMEHADFNIQQMRNWDLLRAHFRSGLADMSFMMSPLALDTYAKDGNFRWLGLMHRDGNALAINAVLEADIQLPPHRQARKPDAQLAHAIAEYHRATGRPVEIAVPHILSTHTVVLYQYLQSHGVAMSLATGTSLPARALAIAPSQSPAFIRDKSNRRLPAAFEQSLPFADIVETQNYGRIAWYSKDIIVHPLGHVECLVIATDAALTNKRTAIREVNRYIRRAASDIETARTAGGPALDEIIRLIRKHIPSHTETAIRASLNPSLRVINYESLDVDIEGLNTIMGIALRAGLLANPVNLHEFSEDLEAGDE